LTNPSELASIPGNYARKRGVSASRNNITISLNVESYTRGKAQREFSTTMFITTWMAGPVAFYVRYCEVIGCLPLSGKFSGLLDLADAISSDD